MRLIIVEDNKSFQQGLKLYTEGALGHTVVHMFDNGKSFIDNISNFTYDVIIMDINMPFVNGIEATKHHDWFHSHSHKILAVTMNYDMPLTTLIQSGFKGCIFKDELSEHLRKALDAIYKGDFYWTSRLTL